jgi:hypothetical protein
MPKAQVGVCVCVCVGIFRSKTGAQIVVFVNAYGCVIFVLHNVQMTALTRRTLPVSSVLGRPFGAKEPRILRWESNRLEAFPKQHAASAAEDRSGTRRKVKEYRLLLGRANRRGIRALRICHFL